MKRLMWLLLLLSSTLGYAQVLNPFMGILPCTADPPAGACPSRSACMDDTNDVLYVCVSSAWVAADGDFLRADGSVVATGTQKFSATKPIEFSGLTGAYDLQWGCTNDIECPITAQTFRFLLEDFGTNPNPVNYVFTTGSGNAGLSFSSGSGDIAAGAAGSVTAGTIEGTTTLKSPALEFNNIENPTITWGSLTPAGNSSEMKFTSKGGGFQHGASYIFDNKDNGGTGEQKFTVNDSGNTFIGNGNTTFIYQGTITFFTTVGNVDFQTTAGDIHFNAAVNKTITLNSTGANTDTLIEGDNDPDLLHADASSDSIGIGIAVPAAKLDVNGQLKAVTMECANCVGSAVLAAGTVTVATTDVTAKSRIFLTSNADGGVPGFLRVTAITAGASFVIQSSSGTDTSTVAWMIVEGP